MHAMRLRAEGVAAMGHFKFLHTALVRALLHEGGSLTAADVRHELSRAEVAFLTATTNLEDTRWP